MRLDKINPMALSRAYLFLLLDCRLEPVSCSHCKMVREKRENRERAFLHSANPGSIYNAVWLLHTRHDANVFHIFRHSQSHDYTYFKSKETGAQSLSVSPSIPVWVDEKEKKNPQHYIYNTDFNKGLSIKSGFHGITDIKLSVEFSSWYCGFSSAHLNILLFTSKVISGDQEMALWLRAHTFFLKETWVQFPACEHG